MHAVSNKINVQKLSLSFKFIVCLTTSWYFNCRFKPPKGGDRSNAFFKMEGHPKSLVRILAPEDKYASSILEPKRSDSPQSGVSKSLSAVTRSTLSELRYRLFGSRSLHTPDYFSRDGVGKLEGQDKYFVLLFCVRIYK